MSKIVPRGAGDERLSGQRVTINQAPVTIKRGRPVTGKALSPADRKRLQRMKAKP